MSQSPNISKDAWVPTQTTLLLALVFLGVFFRDQWPSIASRVIGWTLFCIGGVIGILGVKHLGANRTSAPSPLPQGQLVTRGIFGWMRHPLYSSMIFSGIGWALIWASIPASISALALSFFLYAKACREEKFLNAKFPEYKVYSAHVKRFIPGLL